MAESQQFCTFYLDGLFFGVNVQQVQEVIRYQKMTAVPLAPYEVEGLINLRGQIVTAIDLRRRLFLTDRPEDELPMNVVIRDNEGALSFLVDEIGDVLEVEEEAFERPPETIDEKVRDLIKGVYKLEGRLLLILDIHRARELSGGGESDQNGGVNERSALAV